ncbi:hypothetical protein MAR_009386, partial [Mya arenaria]
MASFKQIIQKSLTAKRYSAIGMEGKENHGYAGTPGPKQNNRVQNDQPRQERVDVETPTRLRKEVEDLTANMQALVSLTPNTLKSRASRRIV